MKPTRVRWTLLLLVLAMTACADSFDFNEASTRLLRAAASYDWDGVKELATGRGTRDARDLALDHPGLLREVAVSGVVAEGEAGVFHEGGLVFVRVAVQCPTHVEYVQVTWTLAYETPKAEFVGIENHGCPELNAKTDSGSGDD
jgi:hypothetical protein